MISKPLLSVTQNVDVLCCFLADSERRGIGRERKLAGHAAGYSSVAYYAWVGSKWNLDRFARLLNAHPKCRVIGTDTSAKLQASGGHAKQRANLGSGRGRPPSRRRMADITASITLYDCGYQQRRLSD
jgi:hypothetical protein